MHCRVGHISRTILDAGAKVRLLSQISLLSFAKPRLQNRKITVVLIAMTKALSTGFSGCNERVGVGAQVRLLSQVSFFS